MARFKVKIPAFVTVSVDADSTDEASATAIIYAALRREAIIKVEPMRTFVDGDEEAMEIQRAEVDTE